MLFDYSLYQKSRWAPLSKSLLMKKLICEKFSPAFSAAHLHNHRGRSCHTISLTANILREMSEGSHSCLDIHLLCLAHCLLDRIDSGGEWLCCFFFIGATVRSWTRKLLPLPTACWYEVRHLTRQEIRDSRILRTAVRDKLHVLCGVRTSPYDV